MRDLPASRVQVGPVVDIKGDDGQRRGRELDRPVGAGGCVRHRQDRNQGVQAGIVADQHQRIEAVVARVHHAQHVGGRGQIQAFREADFRLFLPGLVNAPQGFAGAFRRRTKHHIGRDLFSFHERLDGLARAAPALVQRAVRIAERRIAPTGLGMAEQTQGFHKKQIPKTGVSS